MTSLSQNCLSRSSETCRHLFMLFLLFFGGANYMAPLFKSTIWEIIFERPTMHAYIWPTLDPIPSSLVQLHVGEYVIVTNTLVEPILLLGRM